jgi:hypothetical protein
MSLNEIILATVDSKLPKPVKALIKEGDRRIDKLFADRGEQPHRGFIPSDYEHVATVLSSIRSEDLALGSTFCEWGSGLGIATCLAASWM